METILFFGDSNTWGYQSVTTRRYPFDVRFTGLLSERFSQCKIIEEGLKGRTNGFDDCLEPFSNGSRYLPMILRTHDPIDIFVIMLGTNDVKRRFCNTASDIAKSLETNIKIVQAPQFWGGVHAPGILIISPPCVTMDFTGSSMDGAFDESSVKTSQQLADEYRKVAETYGCDFLDAGMYTGPCKEDGIHLDAEGHRKLADAIEIKLNQMLAK